MYKICNINLDQRDQIFNQIEEYCQEVISKLNPQAIILFGSFASGDINEGSDIDIVVIADFQLTFLDRIKLLLDLNHFGLPIEPVGYTVAEFDKMKQAGNRFIMEVVDKGKVLYQRE
ncbi:nucleotidyltransferase domain-containing protein [Dehalococcoidales bacterium]|nr:nucleotidyltransferase domain-containing protein [Dehalococcoidales bacterium]